LLVVLLVSPAREHLVEEATTKLRRDSARQGEQEQGNEAHRVASS
jgi:hypothetical protein